MHDFERHQYMPGLNKMAARYNQAPWVRLFRLLFHTEKITLTFQLEYKYVMMACESNTVYSNLSIIEG